MSETETERKRPHAVKLPLTRRTLIIFSVAATALFSILFLLTTIYLRKQAVPSIFTAGRPLAVQIVTGLLLGVSIAALAVLMLLKASVFARLRAFIREIFGQIRPTGLDMLLVAICAGVGEELFFRATLQPVIGLWAASLIFALAHTGFSFSRGKLAFAAYVFAMGVLLGVIYEQTGLTAAIVLHAVYDLVFLLAVKRFLIGLKIHPRA